MAIAALLAVLMLINVSPMIRATVEGEAAFAEGRFLDADDRLFRAMLGDAAVTAEQVKTWLQARHLTQGVLDQRPACDADLIPNARARCLSLSAAVEPYAEAKSTRLLSRPAKLQRGVSGHVVVDAEAQAAHGSMVVDTGSVVTILPEPLKPTAIQPWRSVNVSNLGRSFPLQLVRTSALRIAGHELESWVAATSEVGFEREGVLGVDAIYAMGGVVMDSANRRLSLGDAACSEVRGDAVTMTDGVPVVNVTVDGVRHRALLDTGSIRSFVLNPQAAAGWVHVRADFGAARLQARIMESRLELAGRSVAAQVVHVQDAQRFLPGTTAIVGLDVLLAGREFGLCFEPARFWLR